MSALGSAADTGPGRALVDRVAVAGALWPLLAARSAPGAGGRADTVRGRALAALGLNPTLPDRLVTSRSPACIDGFPRSANSLAVYAFMVWNPGVRLAHHMHAAFQLRRAASRGTPTCLLVRPPLETVASVSLMVRGRVSDTACYRSYIRFHRRVEPVRERLAICRFDEVLDDASIVVARLNARFGTAFASEPVTPEQRAWFTERLSAIVRDRFGVPDISAPVPSEQKEPEKAELLARLAAHPLRAEAEAAHAAIARTRPGDAAPSRVGAGARR